MSGHPGSAERPANGALVRALRERRGWTQNQLALEAKVSKPPLIRLERYGRCSLSILKGVAQALEVRPDELFDGGALHTLGEVQAAVRAAADRAGHDEPTTALLVADTRSVLQQVGRA